MKLILLNTLLISFAATICGQKLQKEHFPFPLQFQTPSSTLTNSDHSIYLPLESQTPYLSMSNVNKIPFKLSQPTGTKAPPMYSTAFPIYLSSTMKFDDEENENEPEEKSNNHLPLPNLQQQNHIKSANNNTMKAILEKRDGMFNIRTSNQHTPLQRYEVKPPAHVNIRPNDITQTKSATPASRRMIITSEIQRSDQGPEQIKASSYQNPQYIHAPGIFISSTTEPAIPILRLSNEMDLDGSFSYEALGADQTHYVQHSRMENMGTDKEEQVVEGSYSYIGDDGRTYTVHYVADSNGFRATGDHLPVPPPIPEIIQRAVQYNLAEEAKKPPHLRSSWENGDKENEINERNIYNMPPRNLFTGKTPEAFSFGFSQDSNLQNNLVTAASFHVPAKSSYESLTDQSKARVISQPISPQITFLASQGAHNPSTQAQSPIKVISTEKSTLPQLMNYEAEIKDLDQETNKALWRWQYGLSTNTQQNKKNSISRSSGEGDDIIINFSDMTPEQYTHMIQTQILPQNIEVSNNQNNIENEYRTLQSINNFDNKTFNIPEHDIYVSTEMVAINTQQTDELMDSNDNVYKEMFKQTDKFNKENSDVRSGIISRQNFLPPTQIATQSYAFDDTSFEPSKIVIPNGNMAISLKTIDKISNNNDFSSIYNERTTTPTTTLEPVFNPQSINNLKKIDFHTEEENSSFRPITYDIKQDTTTTERSIGEMIRENIFLRNLFEQPHNKEKFVNKPIIENVLQTNNDNREIKQNKETKYLQLQKKTENEIKDVKTKPLDVNNIFNYVIMKNHFESTKTNQNKPAHHFNENIDVKGTPTPYIPVKEDNSFDMETNHYDMQKPDNDYRILNHKQQQELQGLVKNYKILQRHKNTIQRSQLLSEPQRHIKAFHSQSLPPLGRAGPSLKSYLPPTYL